MPLLSASAGGQQPSARTWEPNSKQGQGCPTSWGEHKDRSNAKFQDRQTEPGDHAPPPACQATSSRVGAFLLGKGLAEAKQNQPGVGVVPEEVK